MAETSNGTDDSNSTPSGSVEWELVPCSSDHASVDISQEQETFSLITDGSGSLEMNYFSVLPDSTVDTSQQSEGEPLDWRPVEERERLPSIQSAEETITVMGTPEEDTTSVCDIEQSLPLIPTESDWIEPCSPYRSCALSTEEDEDSLSRKSNSPAVSDELKGEADWRMLEGSCEANLSPELCTSCVHPFLGSSGPSGSNIPGNGIGDASFHLHRSYLEEEVELLGAGELANLEASLACVAPYGESILDCGEAVADELPFMDRLTEAWWWKHLAVWQGEGGPANTLWSIAVAAAVVGLLILGHRWQRLRWQNQKFRLELSAKEKKIGQLMYQLLQMKECVSCSRRIPVIRAQHAVHGFDKL
eukprot:c26691_g1_i1 orf=629-1711(+)